MKKIMEKLFTMSAGIAMMAVVFAADIPSWGGLHQPAEPANLKEVVENHKG